MLLNTRDKLNSIENIFILCSFQYMWIFWMHNECILLYYDILLICIFESSKILSKIIDWRTFITKCFFFPSIIYGWMLKRALRFLGVFQLNSIPIKIKAQRSSFCYLFCHFHMDYSQVNIYKTCTKTGLSWFSC